MIVIADTSPLNYLVLIGEAEILQRLYGRVIIPEAVWRELQHPETPPAVAEWVAHRPRWLEIQQTAASPDVRLQLLAAGEREAILLAQEHRAEALLLMDEGKGRREASRRNLRITGTLGVLNDAASRDWVDLPSAFERLRQTTFRASPTLLQSFLERDAERKRSSPENRS
jgi:predicted nucleic acid-binding protein